MHVELRQRAGDAVLSHRGIQLPHVRSENSGIAARGILGEALTQDSDQADMANSLLSGIYLARAKVDASHADALRSIEFGEALSPTARKDLAQFRAYKRAVALDVLGRNDEAGKLFAANCSIGAASAKCVLLPEIASSSVRRERKLVQNRNYCLFLLGGEQTETRRGMIRRT